MIVCGKSKRLYTFWKTVWFRAYFPFLICLKIVRVTYIRDCAYLWRETACICIHIFCVSVFYMHGETFSQKTIPIISFAHRISNTQAEHEQTSSNDDKRSFSMRNIAFEYNLCHNNNRIYIFFKYRNCTHKNHSNYIPWIHIISGN